MNDQKPQADETPAGAASALSAGLEVGTPITLTSDIFDDGEDCRPPRYLGRTGDTVFVVAVREITLLVAHKGAIGSFVVWPHEWMTSNVHSAPPLTESFASEVSPNLPTDDATC